MEEDDDDNGREDLREPDESDRNDEPAEVPCPYCKRDISEDVAQCPYCGSYLSVEDAPPGAKPWWWLVAVALLVLLLLGYVFK